ncbi:MAG TPA: S8 family serine peptidase [Gemmatimonadales bacterium]|nr:S8 family serine peptidase [Gemmatimonadales bacterium]
MLRPSTRGVIVALALGACAGDPAAPSADAIAVASETSAPDSLRPRVMVTGAAAAPRPFVSAFVTYRPDAPPSRVDLLREDGASYAYDAGEPRVIALLMPRGRAEALGRHPWIDRIEIVAAPPPRVQSDIVPWSIDSTGATAVHLTRGFRGSGVVVGVLDTRVKCDHGDLASRIVGARDMVTPGAPGCPAVWEYLFPDHGTAVAGIVAGSRNGTGVVGMAPEAGIYSLRVCDDAGYCEWSWVFAGLNMAEKLGLRALNMSFGNCAEPEQVSATVRDQISRLNARGVVLVAAAGNGSLNSGCPAGGPVNGLARLPGVIAVTHWKRDGTQDPAFQYGEGVDLAAPTNVPTAASYGVRMELHPGTSYSAPHVAGAAALLIEAGFSGPDLILRRLAETATDRGPAGWDDHWGWGTINVERAVVAQPFIASFGGTDPITAAGTRTVSANIQQGAPPFAVTWAVSYSDGAASSYTVSGGTSHTVQVPAGQYTITIRATPRETVYGRTGITSTARITVCASSGGGGEPLAADAGSSRKGGSARPAATEAAAGC